MALWLVRAGSHGEYEQRFLGDNRIYATWNELDSDLGKFTEKRELYELLRELLPTAKVAKCRNYTGQLWPFAHEMQIGDWVVVPYKTRPAINIAEITGGYEFDPNAEDPYYHSRTVRWIAQDIPRSVFDQDLLYSFGAFMTICRIKRNDAEQRVREMAANGWKAKPPRLNLPTATDEAETATDENETVDLEQLARDQISRLIMAKFQGHGLARLVEGVLQAQGYTTYRSPEGPDKGIDLLAAAGPLGFGQPRICVQVKSGDSPVDLPALNQLIGAMQNVQADQGLFVSWGGFKSSIDREIPAQFFRVRLWNQDSLIDQILANYDKLDDELVADLPLKRVWAVSLAEEDE